MYKFIAAIVLAAAALTGTAAVAQAAPVCGSTPQSCQSYIAPGSILNNYQKKLAAQVQHDNAAVVKAIRDAHK